jgi:competence protein ComEC
MKILMDDIYRRPVLPLLPALITGVLAGDRYPHQVTAAAFIAFVAMGWIVFRLVKNTHSAAAPLILFSALGYLLIQPGFQTGNDGTSIASYVEKGDRYFRGEVETVPERREFGESCVVGRLTVEGAGSVRGRVRAILPDCETPFKKGDQIQFRGRIKPFRNYLNPNGFDYDHTMELEGIYGTVYGEKGRTTVIESGRTGFFDGVRNHVRMLIDRSVSSREVGAVLAALATGDRSGIPKEIRRTFNETGTTHLLSISGLHVGIVSGVAFFIFYRLLSFIPSVLWQGRIRLYAGLLTVVPVLFYGSLAGMSPSTQRSVIMILVFLMTFAVGTEHDMINSMAVAAMVMLVLAPEMLFTVSFQLSFAAVFFIVWGFGRLNTQGEPEKGARAWLTGRLKPYILVSFLAFAGTFPLICRYFNQVSLIGFSANMVLVPLIGFLVVPIELAAVFISPVMAVPAGWLMKIAGFLTGISLHFIRGFASIPGASIKIVTPTVLEMGAAYVLIVLAILIMGSPKPPALLRKRLMFLSSVVVAILCLDISYWIDHRWVHNDLRVTYLDVGQGSSSLVEFPKGTCMLIDGGGFFDNDIFDMGEKVVAPLLWSKKIGTVDIVVLSHPDTDHMNGLHYILEHFHVRELWKKDSVESSPSFKRLLRIAADKGIRVRECSDLQEPTAIHGVDVAVLWPPDDAWIDEDNDASIVLKVEYLGKSFLFPGDITKKAEKDLVYRAGDKLQSTVLLVPHHGSGGASSDLFLDAVRPEYAVVSAGYRNRYRMPHKSVLERLSERWIDILRTDMDGAVSASVSEGAFTIGTLLDKGDGAGDYPEKGE